MLITKHLFLAKCQTNFLRAKKESLDTNEVIVLRYFAENYQFLVLDEIQSYHGVKNTAHYTHLLYILLKVMEIFNTILCFISDDNNHDKNFVYKIQIIYVDYPKENLPIVDKILYFSDGYAEK